MKLSSQHHFNAAQFIPNEINNDAIMIEQNYQVIFRLIISFYLI
jgi:hypothetical protein